MDPQEKEKLENEEIKEGQGRLPKLVWGIIILWLIYAFFIAPFEISWPL